MSTRKLNFDLHPGRQSSANNYEGLTVPPEDPHTCIISAYGEIFS